MSKEVFGNFTMNLPEEFRLNDDAPEPDLTLAPLVATVLSPKEIQEIEYAISQSDDFDLPRPEIPVEPQRPDKKRFKSTTLEDKKMYQEANQSTSTKRNTAWALRIFQDWHREVYEDFCDFYTITSDDLATRLTKFFCEARPKNTEQRAASMLPEHAEEYHKNTLKNIRAGLNRHLQDIGRDMDIVRDKCFKSTNKTLNGLLKDRMRSGRAQK